MNNIVLKIKDLEVKNIQSNRLLPRRYSIDGLSLDVEEGECILIVGGSGAGKDTLSEKLLNGSKEVSITKGFNVVKPPDEPFRNEQFSKKQIIIKNGFHTRDQKREDLPTELRDPASPQHWELLRLAKKSGATFIALAEIDKLENEKTSEFSRIIVLDIGRIVADCSKPEFKKNLEIWINEYATERHRSLEQDCHMLIKKFGLTVRNDYIW